MLRMGLVTVVLVLLAGCGGSMRTVTVTTPAPAAKTGAAGGAAGATATTATTAAHVTHVQFIAHADTICLKLKGSEAALRRRLRSLGQKAPAVEEGDAVAIGAQVVAATHAAVAEVRALPEPATDSGAITTLLSGWNEEATDLSDEVEALDEHRPALLVESSRALSRVEASDRRLARALGFRVCGSGPS